MQSKIIRSLKKSMTIRVENTAMELTQIFRML